MIHGALGEFALGEGESDATISGVGNIASGEAWGSLTPISSSNTWTLTGIASAEAWGTLSAVTVLNLTSITTAEAWGTLEVTQNILVTGVGNIASGEAWGTASIQPVITLTGIASAETWGTLTAQLIYPPVSRIVAGGFSSGRLTSVAVLGVDLLNDAGDYITNDADEIIGTEA